MSNPVLLYLHGGPGSPAIPYGRIAFEGLEGHFTVVTWDQRGCGKSYSSTVDPPSITLEQLQSDTRELIRLLSERFDVPRVYLMGASFGSVLGALTVRDYPGLIHAYIGVGQFVNAERTMRLSHAAALAAAMDRGNQEAWEQLYLASPLNAGRGWVYGLDIPTEVPRLDVPAFFLAGRFDYKTPGELVEEYVTTLDAPAGKQMAWFEQSAHALFFEEGPAFWTEMTNQVLTGDTT